MFNPAWLPVVTDGFVRSIVAGKQVPAGLFTTSGRIFDYHGSICTVIASSVCETVND